MVAYGHVTLDHGYNFLHQIIRLARGVSWHRGHLFPSGLGLPSQPARHTVLSQPPLVSTMDAQSQQRRDVSLSSLNAAIEAMNLVKEVLSMTQAKAVFGSVSVILVMIRVSSLLANFNRPQANVDRIL
jgi:hypothetical protein